MFEYCRLYVGQQQPLNRVLQQLLQFGYERVDAVADPGHFALRGGVLDLFPATFEAPLRIEFEGARIASMRSFNPKTLETLDRHAMVVVLPRRVHTKISVEVPFEAFVDLKEGDYAVHLDHGIGRYLGRTTITGHHGPQDVLALEYEDGDRLYVPMDQLHLVQKYVAFGARRPALHKLGGAAWERAKTRAYVGAWTYAKSLLDLQAKRVALPGHAFSKDHEWQQAFESAFPYRETPDQLTATADVKRDMEAPRPMDRVLLGDVGYGKTEVAIRAAFKAVMDHRQVAVLVPTTILAYQHYRTFMKRMQGFPIQVEMLTRFQSDSDQRHILRALALGHCDIVIGTHRLLSGDIRFKSLGLLVVDEEQRFGVQDKERLKQWRTQLDVLTLSATPIPRTLYLSLVGARDLSVITTPPENRHPVATHVVEEDDEAMRQWLQRELNRHGQVYVVHNRVHNIHQAAQRIAALVPAARVGVAHGQMAEDALEHVMVEFMEGRIDVLVTTTIIESGIDIPNANTLIVRNAEHFGLADLYQLRGRVGRFDRNAYAYLVLSHRAALSAEARRRLEAMTEHTALGSGFKIAMEDLKIRGAGNLLGVEQSGHVTAVGFDLYCRLLREAVAGLKSETASAPPVSPPNRISRFLVAALLVCGLASSVCAGTTNRIIAIVNDEVITDADVSSHMDALLEQQGPHADNPPDAGQMHQAVLGRLIEQRLILQDARRQKLSVSPEDVMSRLDEIKERAGSEEAFREALAESGTSQEELKQKLREQLLVERVINLNVRSTINVSPQEVASALSANPELAKLGDRVRVSHILVRVSDDRSEEQAKALTESIRNQLLQGGDFAALASRYSEDASKSDGGAMGWVAQGDLLPELDAVLVTLKPGELSPPVQTRLGFHLVRVDERRTASSLSVPEANRAIYQKLYQRKFQDAFARWLAELKRKAYIEIVNPAAP